jgi:hypothetical protein
MCFCNNNQHRYSNGTYLNHMQDQQSSRQPKNALDLILFIIVREPDTMKMPIWNAQQMDPIT